MKKKILCFDLDNTLCLTKGNNYPKAKPKKKLIKLVNELYESGHIIKIFTARYMGRNNDNIYRAKKKAYKITLKQINNWGLKYHKLMISKPSADIYIDDKGYGYNKNWGEKLKKYIKK
mgnify:CR=1 FL=1